MYLIPVVNAVFIVFHQEAGVVWEILGGVVYAQRYATQGDEQVKTLRQDTTKQALFSQY